MTTTQTILAPLKPIAYHVVSRCSPACLSPVGDHHTEDVHPSCPTLDPILDWDQPYLLVTEGVDEGQHMHFYFHSTKCKNTVKKYLNLWGMNFLLFSDPNNKKYAKYDVPDPLDIRGVEIYLMKGVTNHLCADDDLKVLPHIIIKSSYYTPTRLGYIRKCYEDIILKLRSYSKELKKLNEQRKKREREMITSDLKHNITMPLGDIINYVRNHYMKPEYTFYPSSASSIMMFIIKQKNSQYYKNLIDNHLFKNFPLNLQFENFI